MRKWHFSLFETVSTDWQYILKRKANAHNTLKQKYRHYFSTSSRPWHALLLNLDLQFSLTDHEFRTKVFFHSMISVSIVVFMSFQLHTYFKSLDYTLSV